MSTKQVLHGRFLEAALQGHTGHRIALRSAHREWRHAQLHSQVQAAAACLMRLGVAKGDVVALAVGRSFEAVAAVYAVLVVGAVYLPIDTRSPPERIARMLSDTGCRWVVADDPVQLEAVHPGARPVPLAELAAAPDVGPVSVQVDPCDLAYLMFTSGTTGRPKAVAVRHRSAAALLDWAMARFGADDLACVLASTPLSFDVSVFELFAPLAAGGSLYLVDALTSLADLPPSTHLSLINAVPSALAALLDDHALPLQGIRAFLMAGEPLPASLARRLYDAGAERVYNLYGPTEDTVFATEQLVERGASGPVPLGHPLPGHGVLVVDEGLRPVPAGTVGEICLAGDGLSSGYVGQPALTAQRFVPAPPGAAWPRMYRTGDLGCLDTDGRLHFHGRSDHQVKLHGQRVELEEVAGVVAATEGVAQAAVRLHRARLGADLSSHWLVAHVVPRRPHSDPQHLVRAIEAQVQGLLPLHMRPHRIRILDALPLTPHGKVDEAALAQGLAPLAPGGCLSPRTEISST